MATGRLLYRNYSEQLQKKFQGYEIFKGNDEDKSWTGPYKQHEHHSMQLLKKKDFESE